MLGAVQISCLLTALVKPLPAQGEGTPVEKQGGFLFAEAILWMRMEKFFYCREDRCTFWKEMRSNEEKRRWDTCFGYRATLPGF